MKPVLILRAFLMLVLSLLTSAVSATSTETTLNADTIGKQLSSIEADIKDPQFLLERLDGYLEQLPSFKVWARTCIADASEPLADTSEQLKKIGEPVNDEPTDVSLTRQKLTTKKAEAEKTLASCNAILVRSDTAIKEIGIFRKQNLQKQSFAQGRNIVTVINEALTESHQWMSTLAGVLASSEGVHALAGSELLMLSSISIIALVIGLIIRKALKRWHGNALVRWQRTSLEQGDTGKRILAALAMTTQRYITPVLFSGSIAVFMVVETFDRVPIPLITIFMNGLPLLVLVFALTHLVYVALVKLGLRDDIDPALANAQRKRLNILALVWFLGYMLFQSILANSLSEAAFFLARAILGVVFVLNVIWIIWLTPGFKGRGLKTSLRVIASLLLTGALIAELTGYRNLSGFVVHGVVGTLIAYLLLQIVTSLVYTFLDELNAGQSSWQQQIRQRIGIGKNAAIPGFIWVRLVAALSIWTLFIISLLAAWRVPQADVEALGSYITQGFTIGSINIVPITIFEAIIVLIVLLTINGGVQRGIKKKWLTMTSIERGAQESIATVSNYVGLAIAIIVALAVAGLDFSKLAIIAGALSVGIGFGLQNIINNFVSGLILLFERPVKTGDWIVAAGIEGRVKKISIRSTEIESFDRADIIVPNSELISGNLTNWVHKSQNGRIRLPVSVAYGSNTEQVRDLLISIARNHPDIIVDHSDLHDPKVIFLAFGDSSLDLELRFFVRNILDRIDILSDMNFAIDKAFREHDIEIPFPQRDIHIRDEKNCSPGGDENAT